MAFNIREESSTEEIIRAQIAQPLENFFSGRESSVNWSIVNASVRCYSVLPEQERLVHEALQRLYWEFLCNNIEQTKDMSALYSFVYGMIRTYAGLGEWLGEQDIMELGCELLNNCKEPARHFFHDMELLLRLGYAPYVGQWDKLRIEGEIERLAVQDERKRGEFFCVMQAYYSIAINKSLTEAERMQMYDLLQEHWQYLVNVYSVMVKRIVGSGFKTFSQLINNVNIMQSCHPYIHLFHNAVLLRQDDIFPSEKDKEKAVKHLIRMEDIMKETPRDTLLDKLCKVLFGEEFEELMTRKRQLTYDEMKQQVKEYRDAMQTMERNWTTVVNQLKAAVEASVPISVIEKELLRMEPNIALGIFSQLNMLLTGEDAWIKSANDIKQKILERRKYNIEKASISIASVDNLLNNGTLNDLYGAIVMPQIGTPEAARRIPLNSRMAE